MISTEKKWGCVIIFIFFEYTFVKQLVTETEVRDVPPYKKGNKNKKQRNEENLLPYLLTKCSRF